MVDLLLCRRLASPRGGETAWKAAMSTPADAPILHLSSSDWPESQRRDAWQEVYGRQMMRLEITPANDQPFYCELKLRRLPGLGLAWGAGSAFTVGRTPELLTDGDDSLV